MQTGIIHATGVADVHCFPFSAERIAQAQGYGTEDTKAFMKFTGRHGSEAGSSQKIAANVDPKLLGSVTASIASGNELSERNSAELMSLPDAAYMGSTLKATSSRQAPSREAAMAKRREKLIPLLQASSSSSKLIPSLTQNVKLANANTSITSVRYAKPRTTGATSTLTRTLSSPAMSPLNGSAATSYNEIERPKVPMIQMPGWFSDIKPMPYQPNEIPKPFKQKTPGGADQQDVPMNFSGFPSAQYLRGF